MPRSEDDDDSDCELLSGYLLYKDRPEWNDVTPLEQDDGEDSVVSIDYTKEFEDCFGYFRAVLQKLEYSERVLELTETAIKFNPASYTVWEYRFNTLEVLRKDLNKELDFIGNVILKNSKNYQVWNHRWRLIELLNDSSKEKDFTAKILQKDSKNYHAWQHRIAVVKLFKLKDGEIEFVNQLLDEDLRNNSAWNYRNFLVKIMNFEDKMLIDHEIDYCLDKIKKIPQNESAWNYLRGLLEESKNGLLSDKKVIDFCESMYNEGSRCPFLLSLIIDFCYEQFSSSKSNKNILDYDKILTKERGKLLCSDLATKFDKIRANYWEYLSERFDDVNMEKVLETTDEKLL